MNLKKYIIIILEVFLTILPVILIKYYYLPSKNVAWIFISIMSYILLIYIYIFVFKSESATFIYAIVTIAPMIVLFLSELIIYKTEFSIKRILGFSLAIISIALLLTK
jgi:drug/metabolite transporter (DMT)-like permease